ncbi:MAG TPA: ribonuclease III, partial [Bryobacteraceae bacterium]|nr:ribonuclease III [Bryobacteraceae bacterium]
MPAELASLEASIDYHFSNPELLRRAVTHSSLANESRVGPASPLNDNEQLEFLGDSVLGFLIAEALVLRHPEFREGELSRLKAHLVSAAHLHGVARRIDLGSYLELGRSEEMSGGRAKKTLLVDALEAVIAAIYLDGGAEPVRRFVWTHVLDAPFSGDVDAETDIQPPITNFKSALQELAQSRKLPQPRYAI